MSLNKCRALAALTVLGVPPAKPPLARGTVVFLAARRRTTIIVEEKDAQR